jgi:hypothetical protein
LAITKRRLVNNKNFRCWLKADLQPPEVDFRSSARTGHSWADVRFRADFVCFTPKTGHSGGRH